MLTSYQNILVVLGIVSASILGLLALNRFWPAAKRREYNDLTGWQLGILGTTYAVILGFMLYTVWTDYGVADANVTAEAHAISDVYQLGNGLPEGQRGLIQGLALRYAETLINDDWPAMRKLEVPRGSRRVSNALWLAVLNRSAETPDTITAQLLSELDALTRCQQLRMQASTNSLPWVLWWLLILGATLTLGSACLFGALHLRMHLLQVIALSLVIALTLVAIADINRPFQGSVCVGVGAVEQARQLMHKPD